MVHEKVIFVDVDGVLNTLHEMESIHHITPERLALLERIVKETEAQVVISSTWRLYQDARKVIKREFAKRGMSVLDWTPHLGDGKRSDEIWKWMTENPVISYAILDDDWDAHIDGHFFYVDNGLDEETTKYVISFLNRDIS